MSLQYGRPTHQRLEVAALVPTVDRLLDVGCQEGDFGRVLVQRGTEVWGIEPDAVAAEKAAKYLSRVIVGAYPDALPAGESFDCIVFNDVLEHMTEPATALREALAHLNEGGCVVASIPNVRNISVISSLVFRGRWDYSDWGILDRTHVRFFTKATMRELFENSGYLVSRQQPQAWEPLSGKRKLLRIMGRAKEEFVAVQYLMLAYPRQSDQST